MQDRAQPAGCQPTQTRFCPTRSTSCASSKKALRTGMLIHPDAMRLVTANLHLIDDAMRNDKP